MSLLVPASWCAGSAAARLRGVRVSGNSPTGRPTPASRGACDPSRRTAGTALLVQTLTSPLLSLGTSAFRAASRVRGERAIHARGRTLTGRLSVTGGAGTGAPLLDAPGSYDVLVRVSRS